MAQLEANNLLKIHYQFIDNEHFMNAFAFNKCEFQILSVIKEAAKLVKCDIVVNVEAVEIGSLWDRLKLTSQEGHHITVEWIIAIAIGAFINPIGHAFENAIDWGFEYIKDGSYIHSLKSEKERLQLENEIHKLRQDSLNNANVEVKNKIKRRVSNFYLEVQKEKRIKGIGFNSTIGKVPSIDKADFDSYIISDGLEEEYSVSNICIDIIAPVLKPGRAKWRGLYNGEIISFSMKDVEFKKSVIAGSIVFTGGSYIVCDLNIYTEVDNEGETHISSYEVIAVHSYGINNQPPITTESERKRIKKNEVDNQPTLYSLWEKNKL